MGADRSSKSSLANIIFRPNDAATRSGFGHFYSLEYDAAIRDFEQAVKARPDDPFTVNHLLCGVLFRELYRIGALDTELYAKNSFLVSKQFPIEAQPKARIQELIDRALQLSESRLRANPNDVDALYARGVTRAMRSTYIGLVDKAWLAALRSAVGARRDHERVLELDANYTDAKMVVGIHNYVLGSLSWAVKAAAAVVGLGGSKQKGIEFLYTAARGGGEASVDSTIALSLFLRREQRYDEALKLVGNLAEAHPQNYLFALEYANLLKAAGKGQESIAGYNRILEQAKQFPEFRPEKVWYGLAEALRGQRDFAGAVKAYESVRESPQADPDLRQRASLGAGEMYDLMQQHDQARIRYQAVIAADGQSAHAQLARKYLKQPYHAE